MNQQIEYQLNNSVLRIKFSDIVDADTDVIVDSDDYLLPMVDGLPAYLLEKGGQEIKNDVDKQRNAELGDVVVSTAGKLPHKFIFHCITVSPDSRFKQVNDEQQEEMRSEMEEYVIRHAITKCFRLLSAMDLESIAIPCIGVRRAGFSFERVGKIMAEVISDFLMKTNKSYRVELCLLYEPEKFDMMDYITFLSNSRIVFPQNMTLRDGRRQLCKRLRVVRRNSRSLMFLSVIRIKTRMSQDGFVNCLTNMVLPIGLTMRENTIVMISKSTLWTPSVIRRSYCSYLPSTPIGRETR